MSLLQLLPVGVMLFVIMAWIIIQTVKLHSATCGAESDGTRCPCRSALDTPNGQLNATADLKLYTRRKISGLAERM